VWWSAGSAGIKGWQFLIPRAQTRRAWQHTRGAVWRAAAGLSRPPLASVLAYTSKHLLRCYPSAWRMVNNSNPNPAAAWACGVSLAALNWWVGGAGVHIKPHFGQRDARVSTGMLHTLLCVLQAAVGQGCVD
jgi:hypothetical protein